MIEIKNLKKTYKERTVLDIDKLVIDNGTILAVAGALAGILLIAIILWIAPIPAEYDVHLTFSNILSGVAIASIIGILSGILPAWSAARLNPVDAINSK